MGGEAAKPAEFPHQALLGWPKVDDPNELDFLCGGSLISDRYVLTAAHCFKYSNPKVVRLGEHDILNDHDNQADIDVETVVLHPNYKFSKAYHDIALVEMTEAVFLSKYIRPACLWTGLSVNVSSIIATGFGTTEFGLLH